MVLLLGMGFCEVWIRRGGVSENVPGARFPADLARPQAGESTFPHQTQDPSIRMGLVFGMGLCEAWIRSRAGVNDMPAACQSREVARPQAGESAFPHNTLKPKCS